MPSTIKEKVSTLERVLERSILNIDQLSREMKVFKDEVRADIEESKQSRKEFREEMKAFKDEVRSDIEESKQSTKAFKDEMKDFKDEMKAFKDEMKAFKDEMKDFKDEMKDFKDEMSIFKDQVSANIEESKQSTKAFKEEMKVFKDEVSANIEESKKDRKAMNKKWGDLANRLGTFAEDIAAPNIPRIAKEYFGASDILQSWTNHRIKHPSKKGFEYEFDAIVETDQKVFLLETKYTVRDEYIKNMPTLIQNFKECFPVFSTKELIPIFASMSLHESTIRRLSKMGVYAMVMGDETMELINFEAVQERNRGLVDE